MFGGMLAPRGREGLGFVLGILFGPIGVLIATQLKELPQNQPGSEPGGACDRGGNGTARHRVATIAAAAAEKTAGSAANALGLTVGPSTTGGIQAEIRTSRYSVHDEGNLGRPDSNETRLALLAAIS